MKQTIDIYRIVDNDGSVWELTGQDALHDWAEDIQAPNMELVFFEAHKYDYPLFNMGITTYRYKRKEECEAKGLEAEDKICVEHGGPFDDNDGKDICKTCEDWLVTEEE